MRYNIIITEQKPNTKAVIHNHKTMNNFFPKIEEASVEQLKKWVNETSPNFGSLASDELTRLSLDNLRVTMEISNDQSSRQTSKMVLLTWWIVFLTIVMTFASVCSLYLMFFQTKPIFDQRAKDYKNRLSYCLQNGNGILTLGDGATSSCKSFLNKETKIFQLTDGNSSGVSNFFLITNTSLE